jgi:hypothetical protein
MSSRTLPPTVLALVLLVIALVVPAAQAETVAPLAQCQAHPVCSAPAPDAKADLFVPQASSAATLLGATQYIGGCCPNNDASQCPAVNGYSSVHCGFPMCASGFLTCLYS